jgi:nicotinamidase-related amidase
VKKPALVVIDLLNDFLDRWEPATRRALLCSVNELVRLMRERNCPVIWVRQEFEENLGDAFLQMRAKGIHVTIKGTPGCQIVPELKVDPSDLVLVKKRYSAFYNTNLDDILVRLQVDGLIIAGINTHACVRMTAIDAYQRDWQVILAADCIDSYDREHHEISLRYMKGMIGSVLTNHEIAAILPGNGTADEAKASHH